MPRCRDLAIFVMTTDRQTDRQTNRLLYPCACARGNEKRGVEAIKVVVGLAINSKKIYECQKLELGRGEA